MAKKLDGSTGHHVKGSDGVYHVPGELILAAKDVQYNVYDMIKPVLRVAGNVPMVLLTPMFRYVAGRCCGDEEHLTNAGDPEFDSDLAAKLDVARINMRPFLFMDNIRCANVINPTPLMTKMKREECWGVDPVHPQKAFFKQLADLALSGLDKVAERGGSGVSIRGGKRPRGQDGWNGPGGSRGGRGGWGGHGGHRGQSHGHGHRGGRGRF